MNVRIDQATFQDIANNDTVSDEHIQKMINEICAKAKQDAEHLMTSPTVREKAAITLVNWYTGFAEQIDPRQLTQDDFSVIFYDGS